MNKKKIKSFLKKIKSYQNKMI